MSQTSKPSSDKKNDRGGEWTHVCRRVPWCARPPSPRGCDASVLAASGLSSERSAHGGRQRRQAPGVRHGMAPLRRGPR
ncbi:unnamed protein product, partial [Prorocentrum cordatum]